MCYLWAVGRTNLYMQSVHVNCSNKHCQLFVLQNRPNIL